MSYTRKLRFSERPFPWHDSEESKGRSEGNLRSRDQSTRDWRTRDQWEHDSAGVLPKRRGTDEGAGASRDEGRQIKVEPLGYKALEEICKSSSPEDGILDLANKSKRFEALLNSNSDIRPDLMKLIIRAVHLCCSSNKVTEHAEQMLRLVVKTNFLRLHLSSFISQISFHSQLNDTFQPNDVILHLAESFLELLQRFGREIVDTIPFAQLNEAFEELKNESLLLDTDMLGKKVLRVKELRDEIIRRKIVSARNQEDESELEPPQDFREVSVIPQAEDLKIHCKPFLRVNVVGGSYKDLEHYLDVQFRLLREDFILPLRQGIKQLQQEYDSLGTRSSRGNQHPTHVHVYRDVTVLYPVCNGKGMVYRIRLDSSHQSMRRVQWNKSKRLKFGSLLCLSADDFYTLLFATVENRDPYELCRGELEVRFEGVPLQKLNQCIQEKEKFDMVESPTFFEAYRHVLEGLKEIQPDEFPFQEHIVKCIRDVGPPSYEKKTNGFFVMSDITSDEVSSIGSPLNNRMEDEDDDSPSVSGEESLGNWVFRKWDSESDDNDWVPDGDESMPNVPEEVLLPSDGDFASITSDSFSNNSSLSSVDSNSSDGLPEGVVNIYDLQIHRDSLGFNASQMRAFKMALTKKIAVIQGPPGTGKTYVALKIARVLLQSASLWQDDGKLSPMLMVSYTNHALDEFLRGLPVEGETSVKRKITILQAL